MLRKRGKKGIVVAIAFATLALTSVGFSTWITAFQSTVDFNQVDIKVADVLEASTITGSMTDPNFCFDAKSDDTEGPIIFVGGENDGEDLEIKFEITVNNIDTFNGLKLEAVSTDTEFTSFFNTNSKGEDAYFTSPFEINKEINLMTYTETLNPHSGFSFTKNGNTFTFIVTFSWGKYFNNKNPGEVTDTGLVPDYLSALKDLQQNMNGKKITLKITHPASKIESI